MIKASEFESYIIYRLMDNESVLLATFSESIYDIPEDDDCWHILNNYDYKKYNKENIHQEIIIDTRCKDISGQLTSLYINSISPIELWNKRMNNEFNGGGICNDCMDTEIKTITEW